MQEGPREHHILTVGMLIIGAMAMRHGPQIILSLAEGYSFCTVHPLNPRGSRGLGGMLVALVMMILKFSLIVILSYDRIIGFLRV